MATVTIDDLRLDFPRIEALLSQGEEVQITKQDEVIARIVPEKSDFPPLPDFLGRMREIYGDRILEPSGAELISEERDRL